MIAFSPQGVGPILQVSDTGGNRRPLTRPGKGENQGWPEFLPGGKGVLFAALDSIVGYANNKIVAQSLTTDERRELIQSGNLPHYAPSGHLVYTQGANLMAVPFDPRRLAITGAAIPVIEGVMSGQYSLSSTGSLVYVPGFVGGRS